MKYITLPLLVICGMSWVPAAYAQSNPLQGTWLTTLQGRDLDGDVANGFEAYYDTVLNITWLADANFAKTSGFDSDGLMHWNAAKSWAANLNVSGVTGWRLPDVKPVNGGSFDYSYSPAGTTDWAYNITSPQSELAHLYHITLGNKSYVDTAGNNQRDWGLRNGGPFKNLQSYYYWTGVEFAIQPTVAWIFDTNVGLQDFSFKETPFNSGWYAWAVRSGDVAAVSESQTTALALAGLAVAWLAARRRQHI